MIVALKSNLLFICLFTISFFYINRLSSQVEFLGIISDEAGKPLEFATVYIKSSTCGTHTNSKGYFRFECSEDVKESDSLLISFIGYSTIGLALNDYSANQQYVLNPQDFNLDMIEVVEDRNINYEKYIFKYDYNSPFFFYQKNVKSNYQLASRIEKESSVSGKLSRIDFSIGRVSKLEIPIRIKFQGIDESCNCPGLLLNYKDVVVNIKKGKNKVDLKDYDIEIPEDDFYVVFEWLHQYSDDPQKLDFSIGMIPFRPGNKLLGKDGDSDWKEISNAKNARALIELRIDKEVK